MTSEATKRSANFSNIERDFLINLITDDETKKVIECKETDKVFRAEKNKEWAKITAVFNNEFPTSAPRTVAQLKLFYKNVKSRARKKIAEVKVQRYKTGGGSQFDPEMSKAEQLLMAKLKEQFQPLSAFYDDDMV